MTEVSQKAIEGILTTINNWLDKAPDYVVELVHRYSMFFGWANIFGSFIWLIMVIISIILIIKADDIDEWVVCISILFLGWLGLFVGCLVCALKWFLIPEIVLLQQF